MKIALCLKKKLGRTLSMLVEKGERAKGLLWGIKKSDKTGIDRKTDRQTAIEGWREGRKSLCTFRSELRPMAAVGVKARERKWQNGNQYQNWQKTSRPTAVFMLMCPVRDWREMVTFLPPVASRTERESGNTLLHKSALEKRLIIPKWQP